MTTKVIGGSYDFESNLLHLTLEVSSSNESGQMVVETLQRQYDVTSLNLSKGSENIELLGARTKEAMDRIMPQIIANFKALDDCSSILNSDLDRSCKLTVKFQKGKLEASSQILNENFSLIDLASDSKNVQNPQVVQKLLHASNYEGMIKDVKGDLNNQISPKDPLHKWTFTGITQERQEKLDRVLNLFNTSKSQNTSGSGEGLLEVAIKNYNEFLTNQLTSIDEAIGQLKAQITLLKEFLIGNIKSLNEGEIGEINAQRQSFEIALNEYEDAKQRVEHFIPSLIRELSILFSVKNLREQKLFNKGEAPLGSVISKEWNQLVRNFDLLPLNANESLEDHIHEKLGFEYKPLESLPKVDELTQTSQTVARELEETIQRRTELQDFDRESTSSFSLLSSRESNFSNRSLNLISLGKNGEKIHSVDDYDDLSDSDQMSERSSSILDLTSLHLTDSSDEESFVTPNTSPNSSQLSQPLSIAAPTQPSNVASPILNLDLNPANSSEIFPASSINTGSSEEVGELRHGPRNATSHEQDVLIQKEIAERLARDAQEETQAKKASRSLRARLSNRTHSNDLSEKQKTRITTILTQSKKNASL